jgi:DNA-binding NarL/FixJ family response regulator
MKSLQHSEPKSDEVIADTRSSIFLVEDHPITRAGLALLISREADLRVCGEADNAPVALDLIAKTRPTLVVMDIALKTSNGLELMKNLAALLPGLRILVISMHDEDLYAERAMRAGARGYLMKKEAVDKIVVAIRTILGNDIYLSERIKRKLLSGMVNHRRGEAPSFPLDTLSDREMEVFQLIGNGFTTREIAARLNLSAKTIDSYREHLKLKLSLENSAELVRHAIRWARFENIVES